MSEWVDVIVYAALIVALWAWLALCGTRLPMALIADRNPEWIAGHPEIARRVPGRRWFRWSCVLWGTLSLAVLLAFQANAWPGPLAFLQRSARWEALKDLNATLLIAGLLYVSACAATFRRWLHAHVPLASRRQATLERRSIDDHVPRAAQVAVYVIIALHLATWTAVGVTGRYATPAFWGGMAFQFVVAGICLWLVASGVRRRPGTFDRIFGSAYRRTAVRIGFAVQLLPILNGLARLYEQVAAASPGSVDRVLHLGLVLVVAALAIAMPVWSRTSGRSRPTRWPPRGVADSP